MPWPLGNEAGALWKVVDESYRIEKCSQCGLREKWLDVLVIRSSKAALDIAYIGQCGPPLYVTIVYSLQKAPFFVDQSFCFKSKNKVTPI